MYHKLKLPVAGVTLAVAVFCLQACTQKEKTEAVKDPQFQVSEKLLQELKVDTVLAGNAVSRLSLTGMVAPDENKMARIFPLVSGVSQDVHVQLGDQVKKGQTLAVIRSTEVAGYTKDMVSAEADLRSAKRALQSAKDLYQSGLSSEKDLEQAQSDQDKASAEYKRAGAVMAINRTGSRGYEITSPINGYIIEKNLTDHMQIREDNAEHLFTVADLSTVYILINIYESDISKVKNGSEVKITTLSYPDKVFKGKIDKVYSMIDPENKVMRARVKIDNPGDLLKPQMFAKVSVADLSGDTMPSVPAASIIFDHDGSFVLIKDGSSKVHIQPVKVAKTVEDTAYVSEGLKAGDVVISSRQLFLYESLKK